jgi:hypothetical protein
MNRRSRQVLCFTVVAAALFGSAILLAWPHDEIEISGGSLTIGTRHTSLQYAIRSYGYWPYVTVVEDRGTSPCGLSPVSIQPAAACMTALWLLLLWTTAILILLLHEGVARGRLFRKGGWSSPPGSP